jgi:hypothetical protein
MLALVILKFEPPQFFIGSVILWLENMWSYDKVL